MNKIGDFVVKHKWLIFIITLVMLIPSILGYVGTNINYDILVYLPSDIETLKGEEILTDDFNMGSFSISVVQDISDKDLVDLENKIKDVEGVNQVVTINDVLGTTIPLEMLPKDILDKCAKDDTKLMFITFNDSTSDDVTLNAVSKIRDISNDALHVGGMSAMVLDIKELFNSEMFLYVVIAVVFCILVLMIALDNYLVPILLLLNIGIAILFNMGSNIFLGEISYITKAIAAVLQLGVTTDFSIFLYHKYKRALEDSDTKEEAMSKAIGETLTSVFGSSLTTIAGFLALCTMQLTLGKDIGIVMAKGVVFGLLCVIILFPSLLLIFNKQIEKCNHKEIIPKLKSINNFAIKYYKIIFIVFLLLLVPSYLAQKKVDVYYKLDTSIPDDYGYSIASLELKDKYDIVSQAILLIDSDMNNNDANKMVDEIKMLDGIDLVISPTYFSKLGISDDMINKDLQSIYKTDDYKMIIINSEYEIASDELNEQIENINKIVDKYDEDIIVAGEGPLMKDLINVTDIDFHNVNYTSIIVIFVLMMIVLKSISLPILLVVAIEFAIFVNMGVPYFTSTSIPFIASVVIGTIQLGATIDYAILLTTKYLELRKDGTDKMDAIKVALENSTTSILVSALCFFAATVGVGIVSKIDMIGSLCLLLARGALISMAVVLLLVPSILIIFDKVIVKTTLGFKKEMVKNEK